MQLFPLYTFQMKVSMQGIIFASLWFSPIYVCFLCIFLKYMLLRAKKCYLKMMDSRQLHSLWPSVPQWNSCWQIIPINSKRKLWQVSSIILPSCVFKASLLSISWVSTQAKSCICFQNTSSFGKPSVQDSLPSRTSYISHAEI